MYTIYVNQAFSYNIAFILLAVWSLFWTGIALWKAAKQDQRNWFIACLIFGSNTAGLLSIIYLFRFSKKRFSLREIKEWQVLKKSS